MATTATTKPTTFAAGISKFLSAAVIEKPVDDGHDEAQHHKKHHEGDVDHLNLEEHGINIHNISRNVPIPIYYEHALAKEKGTALTSTGALVTRSGAKTGRSPKDKRIVYDPTTADIWWGPVNIKLDDLSFMINRERAIDYLNTRDHLFVVDGIAGWDSRYQIKIRVICERAYHALFMRNMLIRPTKEQLVDFEPDYVIYNAGSFPANRYTKGMTSSTSVSLHFSRKEMVILGTQYAGEMKKGVFTILMYLAVRMGALPLHSSCNEGKDGDVTLFFGLSGTGKTTLSADPNRKLIGDDEHVWTDTGVFNIEGGCYAKCVNLSHEKEPEIFDAVRFGSVLENVVYDASTREVNYDDISITENTRCAYPLEYIPNCKIPAITDRHPTNVIMLTCDAFGVLPPVSKLTVPQAMYHFVSGYTAKTAGTEDGITEPEATFSACYAQPFIIFHPTKYAEMLSEKLNQHRCDTWLVNTGWTGGSYGVGRRISLRHTRAIIDAIHSGELAKVDTQTMPVFGLHVPVSCPGVPSEILMPRNTWQDKAKYDIALAKLAKLFRDNYGKYASQSTQEVISAGPVN